MPTFNPTKVLEILQNNPTLPLDTAFFDEEFKNEILSEIDNLDQQTNGLLIKSENWQALNLLKEKYRGKVKCIYIDPPFNLGENGDFLYKTDYVDSSWLALLENRIRIAKEMLSEDGSIFVRCDYHGNYLVRQLLDEIFGSENFKNEIDVNRIKKTDSRTKKYNTATDSLFWYVKNYETCNTKIRIQSKISQKSERWHAMDSQGQGQALFILGEMREPPKGRHWTFGQQKVEEYEREGKIRLSKTGKPEYFIPASDTQTLDSNWTDISGYSNTTGFSTENAEVLLERVIKTASEEGDLVMDFFMGSGTTQAVAHKLGRKYIGVEMGEYFVDFALPRIKKVMDGDNKGISKDIKWKGQTGIVKYLTLEQYEDVLDNLERKTPLTNGDTEVSSTEGNWVLPDGLPFKYWYTPESLALDNSLDLKKPFANKTKIGKEQVETVVDLAESYNYLRGYEVKKVRVFEFEGWQYKAYQVARNGIFDTLVVWRNIDEKLASTVENNQDIENLKKVLAEFVEVDTMEVNFDVLNLVLDKENRLEINGRKVEVRRIKRQDFEI